MRLGRLLKKLVLAAATLTTVAILFATGVHYYLFPYYCSRLEAQAGRAEVQRVLETWVSENWTGAQIPAGDVLSSDGIGPGVRWLGAKFDGSILGMAEEAHVRLLGVDPIDERDGHISENVEAIYFAERSRYGVLVQLQDRPDVFIPRVQYCPGFRSDCGGL